MAQLSVVNNPTFVENYRGKMPYALIFWHERNNRRSNDNYGDLNTIRNSLAERQWVEDNQIPVCPITQEEQNAAVALRQTLWDEKKAAVARDEKDEAAKADLTVFEELYTVTDDSGNKSLIVPKFSGNAGFRRSRAFPGAMLQRATTKPSPSNPAPDNSFHGLIPVRIVVYKNLVDRLIDQQLENEMQGIGTVKMTDTDKLRVTHDLFEQGCREVDVRRLYSSSTGQKAFGICLLDSRFPELKIYNRIVDFPTESPDRIPWGPVRHTDVVKMNNRAERMRKIKENIPLKDAERALPDIDATEVDNYFRDLARKFKDGTKNTPKMMSKDDINSMAVNGQLLIQKAVADSIINNQTTNSFRAIVEHKEPLNTVTQLVLDGKGEVVDIVAPVLKTEPDLMVRVSRLIASGKGGEIKAALDSIENPQAVVVPPSIPVERAEAANGSSNSNKKKGEPVKTGKS